MLLQRKWIRIWPLALFGLVVIALFYRLLGGQALFWGLPSLQFYPWHEFAVSELAQGRLPLWNPYNGAGAPLLANYQSALLYPPNLLYFIFSGPQTMGILGILHVIGAGYGMWRLLDRWQCDTLGKGIGALAYPLCSTLIARFGTFPMLDAAAWLPWLILAVDNLIDGVRLWRFLLLALVVTMQLLAGHAQWTFYSFVLAGCYALWRLITERRTRSTPQVTRIVLSAVIAVLLGSAVTAAQLLPTAELQMQSQRASGVDEAFALNFSYPPLSLLTLFNPDFFGNPGDGSYAVKGAYFEITAYIGFLPAVLAIIGAGHTLRLMRRNPSAVPDQQRRLVPFFSLVVIIAFVLALGRFGIYPLLYRFVPTFKFFQAPARWLLLAVFALAILAALACSLWKPERRAQRRARLGLALGASLIVAGLVGQALLHSANPVTVQTLKGITVIGLLALITSLLFLLQPTDERLRLRWMVGVLLFVAVDLWWANARSNPTAPASFYDKRNPITAARVLWLDPDNQQLPQAAFDLYLPLNDYRLAAQLQDNYRASELPDLNLLDRQPSLNSFDPLRPDGFERFSRLINSPQAPLSQLAQAAAVGKVMNSPIGQLGSVPRAWMVSEADVVKNADDAESAMQNKSWTPSQSAIIESDTAIPSSADPGSVQITGETPLEVHMQATSPGGGTLVLADTYYPGWEATLDDQPILIYRANLAFRAVIVPPGNHRVDMIYRPRSFMIGALISAIAICSMIALFAYWFLRRRTL